MALGETLVLGLDLGVASVGWALVRLNSNGEAGETIGDGVNNRMILGSRRFETGTDGGEAGIEKGKDESRAAARRLARTQRRQLDRRTQRTANVIHLLQSVNLLPPGGAPRGDRRHDYLTTLDRDLLPHTLARLHRSHDVATAAQMAATRFPYLLRAAAVAEPLALHELGRIFVHLSQRRGYQSNRKDANQIALAAQAAREHEEEKSGVKTAVKKPKAAIASKAAATHDDNPAGTLVAIESLERKIELSGLPTLGAYLASLDPHVERIRTLRTSRKMFEGEFDAIVATQSPHHPILQDVDFVRRLRHRIFFQRALRSARRLRGRCELVPSSRCIARASLLFQRYRMVTEVNNLRVLESTGEIREMSASERSNLYTALGHVRSLSLAKARKEAGLRPDARWTIELDPDTSKGKRVPGEAIADALEAQAAAFWSAADAEARESLVTVLRSAESAEALVRRLRAPPWNFESAIADKLLGIPMEEGYGSYSRNAISRLLPFLEAGRTLPYAIKSAFPAPKLLVPLPQLPPVIEALGDVRNPAVMRSLTEMRKVVNHIVREFGKPDLIRVELARDLKRGRQERIAIFRNNQDRNKTYEANEREAREKVPNLDGRPLNRRDRIKWALAKECGFICPYTGIKFDPHQLFDGTVEVEHIIPRSQHGDDSFNNLTLCFNSENQTKGGKTPFEAYAHDKQRFADILVRVRNFNGPSARIKLEAFQRQDTDDDAFSKRHLNDTRHTARLAVQYLGRLYGHVADPTQTAANDETGRQRVQSCTGGLTALLRKKWGLMKVMESLVRTHPGVPLPDSQRLNYEEIQKRADHRHHAIDALVVALSGPRVVKQLADAAREAEHRRMAFDRLPPILDPWAGFVEDVTNAAMQVVVSQRPDRKINGPLHKATNYSRPIQRKGADPRIHLRVAINDPTLKPADIADPALRKVVEAKLGDGKPDKLFNPSRPETLPTIGRGSGARAVKRVRIVAFERPNLKIVGGGHGTRFVAGGENDHLVVYRAVGADGSPLKDNKGADIVAWAVCSKLEVMRRLRAGQPLVQVPDSHQLLVDARRGDYFQLTDEQGASSLYVLDSLSDGDVQFRLPNILPDQKARGFKFGRPRFRSESSWIKAKPRKKSVSVLGEVSDPHGMVSHG